MLKSVDIATDDHLSARHEQETGHQTVLFLQAHPSTFARNLGDALTAAGCRVLKVNFCVGDWLFWLGRPAINYRSTFPDWQRVLTDLIQRERVTDILYYGDAKPYHRVAGDVATALGVRAFTYEFGYLRPDWITFERFGMSSRSHFPADPDSIHEIASHFGPADLTPRFRHGMAIEITHEVVYHLASYLLGPLFIRYNADRYYNPLAEYVTGLPKQFTTKARHRSAEALIADCIADGRPFYLFPLQLQCDYQLRSHAGFAHQSDAIRAVIASFADHADASARLIIKCHPFDNDAENWPRHIRDAAADRGVTDRVHFIDGGDLDKLLAHAAGCVLINSTVGIHAIARRCRLKVLGAAVFDIPGLAHQGPLDTFWKQAETPDAALADALAGGKGGPHKQLVLAAAEKGAKNGLGRVRLADAANNDAGTCKRFVDSAIAGAAAVTTDGHAGYSDKSLGERPHEAIVQTKAERREADCVQACHWTISLLKRWLLGTHAGAVRPKHLQAYLDEFVFRHNRRKTNGVGRIAARVIESLVAKPPLSMRALVASKPYRRFAPPDVAASA